MITPQIIEEKEFKTAIGGYDKEDVNQFLDEIIIELDRLLKENESLKNDLMKIKIKEEEQSKTDTSLYETLETAKSLMNDIAASAERRAEVLLKNAELDSEVIKKEAKEAVQVYTREGEKLKMRVQSFRNRYIDMLESELKKAKDLSEEFLAEFETDFLPKNDNEILSDDLEKTIVVEKIK